MKLKTAALSILIISGHGGLPLATQAMMMGFPG